MLKVIKLQLPTQPLIKGFGAALLAIPVGSILWFELVYLWFGLAGKEPSPLVNIASFAIAFGIAFGWPLYRTHLPAEVLRKSCRLGIIVSLSLPPISVAVLLVWENSVRPDLGMGGLMLYNMPFVALAAAIILIVLFSLGHRLAARRIRRRQEP